MDAHDHIFRSLAGPAGPSGRYRIRLRHPHPDPGQAIPHALEGRDVLGIAQTGTGKTGAFVLPMLTHLSKGRARARMPRSLVLAPTRELAAQVAEQFEKYSSAPEADRWRC